MQVRQSLVGLRCWLMQLVPKEASMVQSAVHSHALRLVRQGTVEIFAGGVGWGEVVQFHWQVRLPLWCAGRQYVVP